MYDGESEYSEPITAEVQHQAGMMIFLDYDYFFFNVIGAEEGSMIFKATIPR